MSRHLLGPHAVLEALRGRADVSVVYVEDGRQVGDLAGLARARQVDVIVRSRQALDALAGAGRHQGVVAVAGEYAYAELEDLIGGGRKPALLLVLDGVQDPHNLGALVRSACVLGAGGVVIPRDRAAKVTPAVVRASAGATEHMRIANVVNVARAIDDLKKRGLFAVAAVMEGGRPPWEVDMTEPTAIVVGGEAKGVRRLVAERCDLRVTIPAGPITALNASVAGALLLYEARRQREAR